MMQGDTVIIVDDDAAVRDSLEALLDAAGYATECFSSGTEFLNGYSHRAQSCVILDVRMPKIDGLGVLQALQSARQCPPVIVITGTGDADLALRALRSGAVSFLEKPFLEDELLKWIEYALSTAGDSDYQSAVRKAAQEGLESLTQHERQITTLLIKGKSNSEIADQLGCSVRTAEIYRARILGKLDTDTLPQLVHMAILAGWDITEG